MSTRADDEGGDTEEAFLSGYDPSRYPSVAVTADVVLLTMRGSRLSVLLVQRARHPHRGRWALPGGFVEPTEDLEPAARRELAEETGIRLEPPAHLEQLGAYGTPGRDPRMRVVTVAYLGCVPGEPAVRGTSDAAAARFWALDDLHGPGGDAAVPETGGVELAFDHDRIVSDALGRLQERLERTPVALALVGEPFALADLRRVYEAAWATRLHDGNFRRKVLATPGFVEPTGATVRTRGRTARLYRGGGTALLDPPFVPPPHEPGTA